MDDGVEEVLLVLNEQFPAVDRMTGAAARAAVAARAAPVLNLDDVKSAVDTVVPGSSGPIPVRIYRPHENHEKPRPGADPVASLAPAVVFYHGGGFVLCSLQSHDGFCRAMARYTRSIVVSVDYRLAPEHPAPAAAEDAYDAFRWVVGHATELGIDPERIAVAGDSAGGNLAAVTAILCRERGAPMPVAQVLLYPAIDPSFETPSYRAYATGYFNTLAAMQWYWRQYLGGDDLPEPVHLVAPARADSHAGLPDAVLITAGLDPLYSEGVSYAHLLRSAGVPVVHRDFPGLFHGFMTMMPFAPASAARELLWSDMNDLLAPVTEEVRR